MRQVTVGRRFPSTGKAPDPARLTSPEADPADVHLAENEPSRSDTPSRHSTRTKLRSRAAHPHGASSTRGPAPTPGVGLAVFGSVRLEPRIRSVCD